MSTDQAAGPLTVPQQQAIRTAVHNVGEFLAWRRKPADREVAMSLVELGVFEHAAGLSLLDVFELTPRGWDEAEAIRATDGR